MKSTKVRIIVLSILVIGAVALVVAQPLLDKRGRASGAKKLDSMFGSRPLVLMFSQPKCPACDAMKPVFNKMKEEYGGKADFIEVRADIAEAVPFLEKYPIDSVPGFYLFLRKDTVYLSFEGIMPEGQFRRAMDGLIATAAVGENEPKPVLPLAGRPFLLFYTSEKCTKCGEALPRVKQLALEFKGKVDFFLASTDNERTGKLLGRYPAKTLPTVYLIDKKGKTVEAIAAVPDTATLRQKLQNLELR